MIAGGSSGDARSLRGVVLPSFGSAQPLHVIDFATPTAFFGVTRFPTTQIGLPFAAEPVQGTTSATPQLALALTHTPGIALVGARIWWYCEMLGSANSTEVSAEVVNDTGVAVTLGESAFEPENAGVDVHVFSGYQNVALVAGLNTFNLNFFKAGGSGTASVRRVRLTLTGR